MAEQHLDISFETISKIFIAGFVFYVIFLARNIVIWFFFALIISILVEPAIAFFRWLRIPRILAATLVYVSIFGVLGAMIYLTAPIFIVEINQLIKNIPDYFEKLDPVFKGLGIGVAHNFQDFSGSLLENLESSSASIFRAMAAFFGGISSTLFIFTIAFFISLEEKGSEGILFLLVPQKYKEHAISLFERAQTKVSKWFGARILACIFVGVASFAVFFLLGVRYPFVLALISGVLNFVPYVGPIITLLLAILFVGTSNSWLTAVYIVVALLVIQEIENKVITPLLMKKFMDMPPVLVMMSLLIGGTVFGFLGTLFSVPVFGIIYEFLKEFLEKKKIETSEY